MVLIGHAIECASDLGSHAAGNAAEGDVGGAVDAGRAHFLAVPVEADADAAEDARKDLQAVAAADEADVVLVQAQAVPVSDEHAVDAGGDAWAEAGLQAHARHRAAAVAHPAGLQAAAAAVVALAALVVGPARPGLDVVQRLVPRLEVGAGEAKHRATPAARLRAWGLAHGDVKLGGPADEGREGLAVLALHILRSRLLAGEAEDAHDGSAGVS